MIKVFKKNEKFSLNGNVFKFFDNNFISNIKEVYFSTIKYKKVKGWKQNNSIDQFLYVIQGSVKFVIYQEKKKKIYSISLGHNHKYSKIIIKKNDWYAFQGLSKKNLIASALKKLHKNCIFKNLNLKNDLIPFRWNKKN